MATCAPFARVTKSRDRPFALRDEMRTCAEAGSIVPWPQRDLETVQRCDAACDGNAQPASRFRVAFDAVKGLAEPCELFLRQARTLVFDRKRRFRERKRHRGVRIRIAYGVVQQIPQHDDEERRMAEQ